MRLVLFDIDGTLISDGGAAREAFAHALRAVYGYERDLSVYDFSGRTDPQIARMVLRDAEIDDERITRDLPRLWEHYLDGLARNATPQRVRTLPGIRALLDALEADAGVILALLTGNIERGARLKLGGAALNEYFPFGAFGSDSANREDLPPIAVRRAAENGGHRFDGSDVVIIGDSIYDIRCAVPHGATTIAIASGKTPAEKLKAENPSFFFEGAEDISAVLAAIRGQSSR